MVKYGDIKKRQYLYVKESDLVQGVLALNLAYLRDFGKWFKYKIIIKLENGIKVRCNMTVMML